MSNQATTEYKTIASALSVAQLDMGKALKSSTNPHYKSKYADLSSVINACIPALNRCGIAVIQPTIDDETGHYVKTIFIHGQSGETLECRVPLIVGKNDMQGYGSAVTYARRYGLMGMAGIAPDDDDGIAAIKAAPHTVSRDQYVKLRDLAEKAGAKESDVCKAYNTTSFLQFPVNDFADAIVRMNLKMERQAKAKDTRKAELNQKDEANGISADTEIPYGGPRND